MTTETETLGPELRVVGAAGWVGCSAGGVDAAGGGFGNAREVDGGGGEGAFEDATLFGR